eukprot:TRINITY_DN2248_c1_g1_i1.p1 TRINITY_DN2248_c1_g1~~TRINITY_DN2248_c1_g1_i1.p1  ORF type:complete len:670 (-),score=211.36 TRINITY_DN2248_c1_g1_i1:104-2113(-)
MSPQPPAASPDSDIAAAAAPAASAAAAAAGPAATAPATAPGAAGAAAPAAIAAALAAPAASAPAAAAAAAPAAAAATAPAAPLPVVASALPGSAPTTTPADPGPPQAQLQAQPQLGSPAAATTAAAAAASVAVAGGTAGDFDPFATPAPAPAPAPAPTSTPAAGGEDDLLGLGGGSTAAGAPEADDTEDSGKKTVFVYHKGQRNVVGWYDDMSSSDIREAILCACDAITDGGFVLREVHFAGDNEEGEMEGGSAEATSDGRVFTFEEFHMLENEHTYIIEDASEREDLKSITGDRWRRLRAPVEPLLHVEAQKAIERMRKGSNLMKHTQYGFPHLRQFQLSDDRKRLVWYSGAKRKEDSVVVMSDVVEIRLGQTTPVFLHYRLPMLEHLSFSLIYGSGGSRTLDITCKDEFEFDLWVTGLKAVFYHNKNKMISKEELLGHSKRFRKALEKNNVAIKLTKLPEVKEKGHIGLDDCIEMGSHTPAQLQSKLERLRERLRTMSHQVAGLDHHAEAEAEVDMSVIAGSGPAYSSVYVAQEDAQDEEMEIRRMHELVEQTTQLLQQVRDELGALKETQNQAAQSSSGAATGPEAKAKKKKESAACKHIDQLLWKAEVDLENVEDMYLRHMDNQKDSTTSISVAMAEMNSRISRSASELDDLLCRKIDEVWSWFG